MTSQGPLPPVSGVVKLGLQFQNGGVAMGGSRLFFHTTGGALNIANFTSWAGTIIANWQSTMAALYHANISLSAVTLTDLGSATGAFVQAGASVAGTRPGVQLPVDDCVLVNFKINRRYRGGKPKSFLPGGTSSDVTSGRTWAGAFVTAYQTGVTNFINDVKAGSAPITCDAQVSIPYYHGHIANTDPSVWAEKNVPLLNQSPVPDNVVGVTVNPIIGQQRRRLRPG